MTTLTKVFIVLLVISSIAFAMMTVQFSVSIPNWKHQAEQWKIRAQQIDTFNRNLIAAKVAEAARAMDDRRVCDEQKRELGEELQRVQRELQEHANRLAKAEGDSTAQTGTINKLSAELGIAQTSAAKAREHRRELEERNIYLEKANLDLTEAINERIASIIVLEQQTRQQEQAINLMRGERDKLLKKLRLRGAGVQEPTVTLPTDKVRPATVAKVAPIRGAIREVSGEFASISVGSNDGVEIGMTFIIYNRSGYLGDLEISDVQPNRAAGALKFVTGNIAIGDMVADENGYLAMN